MERAQKLAESLFPDRIALLVSEAPDGSSADALVSRTGLRADDPRSMPANIHRFGDWFMHEATQSEARECQAVLSPIPSRAASGRGLQQRGIEQPRFRMPRPVSSNNCFR